MLNSWPCRWTKPQLKIIIILKSSYTFCSVFLDRNWTNHCKSFQSVCKQLRYMKYLYFFFPIECWPSSQQEHLIPCEQFAYTMICCYNFITVLAIVYIFYPSLDTYITKHWSLNVMKCTKIINRLMFKLHIAQTYNCLVKLTSHKWIQNKEEASFKNITLTHIIKTYD